MKKNEFLISFGLIVAFAFVIGIGTSFAPAPRLTTEVQTTTSVVMEEGVHFIYENTAVVRSDGKILAESQKLIGVE